MKRRRLLVQAVLLSVVWLLPVAAVAAEDPAVSAGGGCPDVILGAEELKQYTVVDIRIQTPFDFLGSVQDSLVEARAAMPQKQGSPFNDTFVSEGTGTIERVLRSNDPGIGSPVNITATIASIENCRPDERRLDVVYRVFTSRLPFFSSRVSEARAIEDSDPAEGAGMAQSQSSRFLPRFGYNKSAKAFGGAEFKAQNQGPIDSVSFSGLGSAESARGEGLIESSWRPGKAWLQQLDWRAFYDYTDLPSESGRLKKNVGGVEASALLRSLGPGGPMLRLGVATEGGNAGSRADAASLPAGVLVGADYSAVKAFVGTAWRGRRQSIAGSYGIKIGTVGSGFGNGFQKHLGDLAYKARWLPSHHRPLELDLRLSGGAIVNNGGLPVSERFFGGNVEENFLHGDSWRIASSPVIRSFPQNRLDRVGQSAAIGGESFVALNVTLAPTIWRKPLVPDELLTNQEFQKRLDGALGTIEQTLGLEYESRDPAIDEALAMRTELEAMEQGLKNLLSALSGVEETVNESSDEDKIDRYFECLDETDAAVALELPIAVGDKRSEASVALWKLVRNQGTLDFIGKCAADDSLKEFFAADVHEAADEVARAREPLFNTMSKVDREGARQSAATDIRFTRRVLDTFLNEINLASISPVFIFDAARLGSELQSNDGFRYGVGAGIRFSLVSTVNFTVAYAANPNRRPWESRGAWVFSLDVADLFY